MISDQEFSFSAYVHLTLHILTVLTHAISAILMLRVVYYSIFKRKYMEVKSLSICLWAFLILHISFVPMIVSFDIYLIYEWTPNDIEVDYDPHILLLLGMWPALYYMFSSLSALCLTIERCLVLQLPVSYKTVTNRLLYPFEFLFFIIASILYIGRNLLELPLDVDKLKDCQIFTCVTVKYPSSIPGTVKLCFCLLNLVLLAHFTYILRGHYAYRTRDRLAQITIITEVIFDTIPVLFVKLYKVFGGSPLVVQTGTKFGELQKWLLTVHVLLCAICYHRLLLKTSNGITSVQKINVVPVPSSNT
ncbi:hypothetical protein DdX_19809 [Ditylenchus destructor]|uniref:Uncharacterized protein n=1 Tax=Ditylenchus destructor TaxID=166010 RepID=A0AAD4MLX1_9BILA|nr:hypothetical protein DdX_19809 [Ditylenchus destructor]